MSKTRRPAGWPTALAVARLRRRRSLEDRVASPADRELLTAVALRDRSACEALCRRFGHRLYGFLLSRAPAQEAEELVQEVMRTVWTRAANYKLALAAPSTWILTIAWNNAKGIVQKDFAGGGEVTALAGRPGVFLYSRADGGIICSLNDGGVG